MDKHKVSWDDIEELDDMYITYFLYKEGKSMEAIEKIRNYSREKVEKDIIEAKIKIHALNSNKQNKDKSTLDILLELSKDERLEYIHTLTSVGKKELVDEIKDNYKNVKNPEDKMLLIWIIGELKEGDLISIMSKDILHRNGNVRRMVCSALGKMEDSSTKNILHRALKDEKPQVKQYAAKALKNIGDESTIHILKGLISNGNEKKYVKRTCIDTIKSIENKVVDNII